MTQNNDPVYIALGANLSNPKQTFRAAINALQKHARLVATSNLWQSPAWPPGSDAPDYLNAAISIAYTGTPSALLSVLQDIESAHGRVRTVRNAPRTLDLDILDFKGQVIEKSNLSIPHPRMLSRGFVLLPLQEVAPDWHDPVAGLSITDHIAKLPLEDVEPMSCIGPIPD